MDRQIEHKKWTPKKNILLSGVSVGILGLSIFLLFGDYSSTLNVDSSEISIGTVAKDKFQEFIPIDGVVQPIRTIFIDAIQGGTVKKKLVEDGTLLKTGDTILALSNPNLELEYMNRESQMYDVINNLQNSKLSVEHNKFNRKKEIVDLSYQIEKAAIDFERKKKFHAEKLISNEEFETAQRDYLYLIKQKEISLGLQKIDSIANINQVAQINSSIERMYKNLSLLKLNLGSLYVTAPVSGQLSSFNVEIGETKAAGQNLGQIDVTDGYKLRANIDERYITRVFIGQEAEFDFSGKCYIVKVGKIYTQVTNGSFKVDLLFPQEAPKDIKRGLTLQVRLKFSSPVDAIVLERGGFFQETGGNWVYVIDPLGKTAIKRSIKVGRQNTNYYEILEGLKSGEKVIISSYAPFENKEKLILN